jgi:hypothetical protein
MLAKGGGASRLNTRGVLLSKKRTNSFGIKKYLQFFLGFWDFFAKFLGILG